MNFKCGKAIWFGVNSSRESSNALKNFQHKQFVNRGQFSKSALNQSRGILFFRMISTLFMSQITLANLNFLVTLTS